ncbi:MAG: YggT family protein [Rhodocyclaceae bacterium]|nr:YggT family protein [Rhodocyclaceae bacterium]
MLIEILGLLLGTASQLMTLAFLARLWMQWTRAPFRQPLGQFLLTLTDWAVLPLRRWLRGLWGIDWASVLAAWLVQLVYLAIMTSLTGLVLFGAGGVLGVALLALLAVVKSFVYLLMGVIIIAALLSWINPYSPLGPLFETLARPLLAPLRRFLPAVGGIDLSPLVALLLLQVVLIVLGHVQPLGLLLP